MLSEAKHPSGRKEPSHVVNPADHGIREHQVDGEDLQAGMDYNGNRWIFFPPMARRYHEG
jgi:hypothetical protein